jgi:enoyl-CoA hydratase
VEYLTWERRGNIGIIALNRPARKNALTPQMLAEMEALFKEMAGASDLRCLVLRGSADSGFCSGFDLTMLPDGSDAPLQMVAGADNPLEKAFRAIGDCPQPVIALLQGAAFGAGCELAAACDLRVGTFDLVMGMPPARIGIVYSADGLRRFVSLLGLSRTRELFFTGKSWRGERLLETGLLDHLVAPEEIEDFTIELAATIAQNAPIALAGIKRTLKLLADRLALDAAARQEADGWVRRSLASEDLTEGKTAMLERRRPRFRGR